MFDVNIENLTVHEAHRALKAKQISSVELTRAYLRNIKERDPKVRSLVTVMEEAALVQAQRWGLSRPASRSAEIHMRLPW